VPSGGDLAVSFALNGYQPTTLQVRAEALPSAYGETGPPRLQPNPVYAELQPIRPPPTKKKSPAKPRQTAQKATPAQQPPSQGAAPATDSNTSAGFPWPDPPR
jgi:hypothetical protein